MTKQLSKKWFDNIKALDNKNKLAHGEIYSRDGSVFNLVIDNNVVTAKVKGVPGEVFDVKITFSEFSNNDKSILKDYILKNPFIYSKLLNNEFPEELLDTNVKLMPSSLKDFKMECNCKIKGLFCKHKAAVFHTIKREILKNPFLLFSLRGFDINKLTKDNDYKIKKINNVLNTQIPYFDKLEPPINIPDLSNNFIYILNNYPSFYPSNSVNFREIIAKTLKSMSACIYQIQNSTLTNDFKEYVILTNTLRTFEYFTSKSSEDIKSIFEDKWRNPQKWDEFNIDIDENYNILKLNYRNFNNANLKQAFFAFGAELSQLDINDYNRVIKFVHDLYLFTSELIYFNALIPELFELDNGMFHIRWIPAFNNEVLNRLDFFFKNCPDNLVTCNGCELSKVNQIIIAISLIFEGFSNYFMNKYIPHDLNSFINDIYYRLFFLKSQSFTSDRFKGKEILINNWISPLFSKQKDYTLIFDISQHDHKFHFKFNIEIDNSIFSLDEIILKKRFDIIRDINNIEEIFSKFSFDFNLNKIYPMNLKEFNNFYQILPIFELAGVRVNIPFEFSNTEDAKLVLDIGDNINKSSLTLDDLDNFNWKIAIGDETIPVDEFNVISSSFTNLIKTNNKYYRLNEKDLEKITYQVNQIPKSNNKSDLIQFLLSMQSDSIEFDEKIINLFNKNTISDISVPDSLNGHLRKYQETGFNWIIQNIKSGFGSILADDMGLGKTIQVITSILYLKENHFLDNEKVLVIAPTSILTNWQKEIEKFTPSLNSFIYHGTDRVFPSDDFDIMITSYGIIRQDSELFNDKEWFLVVIDEAQNIKNPKSKQTLAIKSIEAKHKIALSGTPVENRLAEYWSIFDFTNKGYLQSLKTFKKKFINPIEKNHDRNILNDFKKITSPFILRRNKSDKSIIKDLPDKIINDIYCNLSVKQAAMYNETLNVLIRDVEQREGIGRKGVILKLINSLKQICNHPAQFSKSDKYKIDESGKMEVLLNLLENIIDANEQVLIFTQYVKMGEIIKNLVGEKLDVETLFLHGSVSRKNRDEMIAKFQNGEPKIFIISLKAGGTGLNLTAASNVIHYDLWWNPAVENQATDRSYRIGQNKNVMVYRFITTGTFEEKINQMLIDKRELAEMTIEGDEKFITEMSNDDLRDMLELRSE